MRITCVLVAAVCLAACSRGIQNKEAVRQGVIDYLAGKQFPISKMDVEVTAVQFSGDQADATVSIGSKDAKGGPAMTFTYQMQKQAGKWVVTGRKDAGGVPHGGGAIPPGTPGMANPHGGGVSAPPGGGGGMPSPQDLPPVQKKQQ